MHSLGDLTYWTIDSHARTLLLHSGIAMTNSAFSLPPPVIKKKKKESVEFFRPNM